MKKQGTNPLLSRFDLPAAVLTKDPVIEIQGRGCVAVDNHRGILEYSRQAIWLRSRCGSVGVLGNGLTIALMTKDRIEVCGTICAVELR